jgi:tripartite-type tricarboxylate transporter receptor subunit TctC
MIVGWFGAIARNPTHSRMDWEDAMHTVSRRAALAGLAFFALWPGPAGAQEQTLKIVFPFSAGSSTDAVARMLADHMQERLGRAVIVENRTGAGGRIGLRAVRDAAPDGATLLLPQAAWSRSIRMSLRTSGTIPWWTCCRSPKS